MEKTVEKIFKTMTIASIESLITAGAAGLNQPVIRPERVSVRRTQFILKKTKKKTLLCSKVRSEVSE